MVNAGRILIMPRGEWDALTSYNMLDLVTENGVAYLAKQTNVGQDPAQDSSMTYWQPFGSSVVPDNNTIIFDANNKLAVNIDGETLQYDAHNSYIKVNIDGVTLKYDAVNGYIYADVSSSLAGLTDVQLTSIQNGQIIAYNSALQKFVNINMPVGGGSKIKVTTSEAALYGQTVTLSDGVTTLSGTLSNSGEYTFEGVELTGNLTISSTDGVDRATRTLTVQYYSSYAVSLAFFEATVTVTFPYTEGASCSISDGVTTIAATGSPMAFSIPNAGTWTATVTLDGATLPTQSAVITTDGQTEALTFSVGTINLTYDNDFRGTTITCAKGGTTMSKTAPGSGNTMIFYPTETGLWTITGTVSSTPYTTTVTVASLSTAVSATLNTVPNGSTVLPTDDIETWLACGQITGKSYTTLSQVLDDAETYERLLSDSNACDYMARSTTWASTICADADAMMRLGKYDYACDALLADSTWASAIATSTYVSYVLDNATQVPTMTSNTTPSGEVSTNYKYASREPYQAFDGQVANFGTGAHYWYSTNINQYLEYEFTQDVCVTSVSFYYVNTLGSNAVLKIQASDDNETWTDLITDGITLAPRSTSQGLLLVTANIDTAKIGKYCRAYVYSIVSGGGGTNGIGLNRVQFNGYYRHTAQTDIIVTAHGGDTVYYMENGSPVPLTTADSDTGIGTVDWSDLPKGAITLYSSTAKNPSDLTADYSKTVYVTENTTQIYLMPDNALYWWGYQAHDYTLGLNIASNVYGSATSATASTYKVNAYLAKNAGLIIFTGSSVKVRASKVTAIVNMANTTNGYRCLCANGSLTMGDPPTYNTGINTFGQDIKVEVDNITGDNYVGLYFTAGNPAVTNCDIFAIFYEIGA